MKKKNIIPGLFLAATLAAPSCNQSMTERNRNNVIEKAHVRCEQENCTELQTIQHVNETTATYDSAIMKSWRHRDDAADGFMENNGAVYYGGERRYKYKTSEHSPFHNLPIIKRIDRKVAESVAKKKIDELHTHEHGKDN